MQLSGCGRCIVCAAEVVEDRQWTKGRAQGKGMQVSDITGPGETLPWPIGPSLARRHEQPHVWSISTYILLLQRWLLAAAVPFVCHQPTVLLAGPSCHLEAARPLNSQRSQQHSPRRSARSHFLAGPRPGRTGRSGRWSRPPPCQRRMSMHRRGTSRAGPGRPPAREGRNGGGGVREQEERVCTLSSRVDAPLPSSLTPATLSQTE